MAEHEISLGSEELDEWYSVAELLREGVPASVVATCIEKRGCRWMDEFGRVEDAEPDQTQEVLSELRDYVRRTRKPFFWMTEEEQRYAVSFLDDIIERNYLLHPLTRAGWEPHRQPENQSPIDDGRPLLEYERQNLHAILGALLRIILKDKHIDETEKEQGQRAAFPTQEALEFHLVDTYKSTGISLANLKKVFSKANQVLKERFPD